MNEKGNACTENTEKGFSKGNQKCRYTYIHTQINVHNYITLIYFVKSEHRESYPRGYMHLQYIEWVSFDSQNIKEFI